MATNRKSNGQWTPGTSGNPNGRKPAGTTLAEMLRMAGDEVIDLDGAKASRNEHLVKLVWRTALGGDMDAVKILLDRIIGRVPLAGEVELPAPVLLLPAGGPWPWGGHSTVRTAPAQPVPMEPKL